jgi:hypothetical protein
MAVVAVSLGVALGKTDHRHAERYLHSDITRLLTS